MTREELELLTDILRHESYGWLLYIFVIRENEIFISVIRDLLFFFRSCQRPPCTTLFEKKEPSRGKCSNQDRAKNGTFD